MFLRMLLYCALCGLFLSWGGHNGGGHLMRWWWLQGMVLTAGLFPDRALRSCQLPATARLRFGWFWLSSVASRRGSRAESTYLWLTGTSRMR